jgi:hypothetical protein
MNNIPPDAVLLIPEPEAGELPAFGIKPGYYTRSGLLELVMQNRHNPDAIQFIAEMLEIGDGEHDGFALYLKQVKENPVELERLGRSLDAL